MTYISDRKNQINLPFEPGLLEWLQAKYPYSGYKLVTVNNKELA